MIFNKLVVAILVPGINGFCFSNWCPETDFVPYLSSSSDNTSTSLEETKNNDIQGGLTVLDGGISVFSGGVDVKNGGLSVEGGLSIKSGSLTFEDDADGFQHSGKKGIESEVFGSTSSAIVGKATNQSYKGSLLTLDGPHSSLDDSFTFFEMNQVSTDNDLPGKRSTVFSVMSSGTVRTIGSMYVGGDMSARGFLNVDGALRMKRKVVKANETIEVGLEDAFSFLEIIDDGVKSANKLVITGNIREGHLLLIKNGDKEPLFGALGFVPAESAVFFVSGNDPNDWSDITTIATQSKELSGITKLDVLNDIDIGKHTFACENIQLKSKSSQEYIGQLLYFGPGGEIMGDQNSKIIRPSSKMPKGGVVFSGFDASFFTGDLIDFRGGAIANAAMTNVTIDKLEHLKAHSLEIVSECSSNGGGIRMATINEKGGISTAKEIRWDTTKNILHVPSISSSKALLDLKIHSDIDMTSHQLRNFEIEKETILKELHFNSGWISDTILTNVTAQDLKLDSVEVESLKITSTEPLSNHLSFLAINDKQGVTSSTALYESKRGDLIIEKASQFKNSLNINGNQIINALIANGSKIEGDDINVNVNSIIANTLTLSSNHTDRNKLKNKLALFDENGNINFSDVSVSPEGWIETLKISGSIDFRSSHVQKSSDSTNIGNQQGKILNASIDGGQVRGLESLQVSGDSKLEGDVNIQGETIIGGGLIVSGSVLGSGPYIDLSDERLKKNIRSLSTEDSSILDKLIMLNGVSYELDIADSGFIFDQPNSNFLSSKTRNENSNLDSPHRKEQNSFNDLRQIGFLAQEVEKLFPLLVKTSPKTGRYKGVHYARFIPLITEAMKEMRGEVITLSKAVESFKKENKILRDMILELRNEMNVIRDKKSITRTIGLA